MKTKIYVLCEADGTIRYVGKTVCTLEKRFREHRHEVRAGGSTHKLNWLRRAGNAVQIVLIHEVSGDGAKEEIAVIAGLRGVGTALVNGTEGGDGCHATADTRAKMSAASRGKPKSQAHRDHLSDARKGFTTPAIRRHLARLRESNIGRVCSTSTRAKIGAKHRGKQIPFHVREKMSLAKIKITPQDVTQMQQYKKQGWSIRRISRRTGFSRTQIGLRLLGVKNRHSFKRISVLEASNARDIP